MPDPVASDQVPLRYGLAEVDDHVVGCSWLDWWSETDETRVYLLLGSIVPEWRGRGLGRQLLAWQEQQAAARAATERIGNPVYGANVGQAGSESLLRHCGYTLAFTGLTLECEPAAQEWKLPAGIKMRDVASEKHRMIYEAIADSFSGPRLGSRTFPYVEYLSDFEDTDLGLWRVAWDGDQIAGLAITTINPNGIADTPWVGVRPPWRRRGIARTLMLATLDSLIQHGVRRAVISTHLENTDNSVGLYESVGYRITERRPRYRKPIR